MGNLFILVLLGHFLESKFGVILQLKKTGISIYGCSRKETC